MSLDPVTVTKIAQLARLALAPEEIPRYAEELSNILTLVEQMNSVDTRTVIPMAHPLNRLQRLRADQVTEYDQRERYQAIAPCTEAGLYLVPKVIE